MRKILSLLTILLFSGVFVFAQNKIITGVVKDESGVPLSMVSVVVKGTTVGTTTASDGTFSIKVPATAKQLDFSFLGHNTKSIMIGSKNHHEVTLESSAAALTEVVITGYGREKKSQFTGAATTLSAAKTVENVPVGSFDQALQGRAPGLLVNSGSGQPGSSATLTIRGVKSIQGAGAQPLYILDGIPIAGGDFQTLNPDDFETLTILKDAGAAALYGARGATGVVAITTKKGKAGTTNITVRSQYGFTQAPDFSRLNMMNTPEILEYENRLGLAGLDPSTPGWAYAKNNPTYALATPAVQARRDFMLDSISKINTDFSKVFYRQGISQSHDVSVSGGTDKTKFYMSGGYFDQQGIDRGSALKRYTTKINLEHTANRLSIQWNNAIGFSIINYSEGEALGNSARNPFQMTYRAKPYEIPYKVDGTPNFGTNTTLALKQVGNLLEGIENSSLQQKQIKVTSGLTVAYKIVPSVTVKNTFGIDASSDLWQRYIVPGSYIGSLQTFGSAYPGLDIEAYKLSSQIINTSSVVFAKRIDKHDFEAAAYFEVVRGNQKALGFTLYNLDYRLQGSGQGAGSLPVGTNTTYPQYGTSARSGFGIRSYFATGRYTYENKYTLTANIRRDGTSRIVNPVNKEITTWSAGATWNTMEENFLKNQNVFSDLRVRASYGVVPNIGSISSSSYGMLGTAAGTWVSVTNYQGPQLAGFGTSSYPGSPITGLIPSSPGNPNYKIEKVQMANIGADFAFWKNRARFTVDVYQNTTVDLFVSQPLPAESGFGTLSLNAGKMSNKGIEFTAAVDVVKTRDFNLNFGFNHAININKIVDLGAVNEYFLGTFVIRKGLAYGSHYTYNYLGADPATGKPIYETADGKTTNDIGAAGQFAKFGTYLPKHVGGFNGSVNYKGFSVEALFSYQFDVVRSNNIRNWITRGTSGYQVSVNGSRELLTDQWQKPGDKKFFQAPNYDRQFTSSDLEDAKFLRFRSLNVAYQLPAYSFKGNSIIKGATFYVQMQNIAVWSPWRGLDPEDNNNISLNEYPNPKMIVTGFKINL
jgi:TonB-linked SusC/RagA family outer membrane protein